MAPSAHAAAAEAKKPFRYPIANNTEKSVTIVQNNTAKRFRVSKQLLKRYTPNFYNTITDRVHKKKAKQCGMLQLQDIEHETFKHFVEWLEHQVLWDEDVELTKKMEDMDLDEEYEEEGPLYNEHGGMGVQSAKIYAFACNYDMPQLRRDALDRLLTVIVDELQRDTIAYVYRNTEPGSPLRRVVVGSLCVEVILHACNAEKSLLDFPKDYLVDVMLSRSRKLHGGISVLHCHAYHECDGAVVDGEVVACT